MSKYTVAIIGATGYTGLELLRLLKYHPSVTVSSVTSRSEQGVALKDYFIGMDDSELVFEVPNKDTLKHCDVVFFATPHKVAMEQAGELLDMGVKVVDLSADFRILDTQTFEQWYQQPHATPNLLAEAVYGLPELERDAITKARLIANPGCYPTSILLPLVPLLKEKLVSSDDIIIDSKSGVSGAGRKAAVATSFSECADDFKAYGLSGHRHLPEIHQQLQQATKQAVDLTFIPHLLPQTRGIESTIYLNVATGVSQSMINECWRDYYADEPFITLKTTVPTTKEVRGTNQCAMFASLNSQHSPNNSRLVVSSVIDNLVKGAAGQAIQNMNLMLNLPETSGLQLAPLLV